MSGNNDTIFYSNNVDYIVNDNGMLVRLAGSKIPNFINHNTICNTEGKFEVGIEPNRNHELVTPYIVSAD